MELKPEAFKGIMFKAKRSEKIFKNALIDTFFPKK